MIGGPPTPAGRLERFRAWIESFTGALEAGDLDRLGTLFAVECSWQPGPFTPVIKGRTAIRAHVERWLPHMPGLGTRVEILGVGTTYAVARWTLTWGRGGVGEHADGVLLVALDPTGRCSAIREWTLGEPPPA